MKFALDSRTSPARMGSSSVLARRSADALARSSLFVCLLLISLQLAWFVAALTTSRVQLTLLDPGETYAERRLITAVFLAAAITLLSLAHAAQQPRLRWVAFGLLMHAVGTLVFGDILLRSLDKAAIETSLYGIVLTRAFVAALTAVGLLLASPPVLTWRPAGLILVTYAVLVAAISMLSERLPSLATFEQLPLEPATGITPGFTTLYWILSLPFALLAAIVAVETARRHRSWEIGIWIVLSTTVLAGFVFFSTFRPSYYGISTEFTAANALMTTNWIVIVLGATLNLRRIAAQTASDRDALAEETQRLADLARLRADFTTMVAHELSQPLLAIRRTAEVLSLDELQPAQRQAVASITSEANALFAMIDDVRASGAADSDDFSLEFGRVPVDQLFDGARVFADTLPGEHRFRFDQGVAGEIWADPARIEQVLRNLLNNADRYTPPQAGVTMRALPAGNGVARFEVEDEGPGIAPDELRRIFEKYERGSSTEPGLGVGLYLSRRILRNSGSDLHYRPGARGGACFWFDLPRVTR